MVIFINYYIVGILGTGCSSLACYLHDLGHNVKGSDKNYNFFTKEKLIEKNIKILEFNKNNITGNDIYIIGHSYDKNIETRKIIKEKYIYYYYNEFIELINKKIKFAVSGTHGKTTTCKILVELQQELNPSYIIGDGSGFGNNNSNELIFEACEYQDHFLKYHPDYLIINNIELDHPDYFKNEKQLVKSFQQFATQSKVVIINGDNKLCKKIHHDKKLTFGFSETNDYRCKILKKTNNGFIITINEKEIMIPFVGIHMIYNFLAAYAATDIYKSCILNKIDLKNFSFPKRRMNTIEKNNNIFIDDYAHHPTEIQALYNSIKQKYPNKKIIAVFQPHTYTRTYKFRNKFKQVLQLFDLVFIYKTFNSREKRTIFKEIRVKKIFNNYLTFEEQKLINIIKTETNNIYLFIGAGHLNIYLEELLKKI